MKLFKDIDEKFAELGFEKIEDNETHVLYKREVKEHNFVHAIEMGRKRNGKHLIHSCVDKLNKNGYNDSVGLTEEEAKLALAKLKSKKW